MDKHLDLKLKTIAGLPISVGNIVLTPYTLKEIINYGYEEYHQNLHILTLKVEEILTPEFKEQIRSTISLFDLALLDKTLLSMFVKSLLFFLREQEVHLVEGLGLVFGEIDDSKIVNNDNFNDLIEVIKVQNNFQEYVNVDIDFKPKSSAGRTLKEKMMSDLKKAEELKQRANKGNALSLFDLISILSANANGISIFNVFDLNMLQFNDQFNRMKMLEDYNVNIQALMHGADSKSIELKHWMSKVN
ncbi:hypothetical protein ABE137_07515 [Brevibacillus laterosporus]|uniref:hypothetical protein n=1 Tax=Brevibacillus laterosporus TaxID=1465 RepID=UPI003D1E2498